MHLLVLAEGKFEKAVEYMLISMYCVAIACIGKMRLISTFV